MGGAAAHLVQGHRDGGQPDEVRGARVVDAGDGDVAGHVDAGVAQADEQADRGLVVGRDHRLGERVARQQHLGGGDSVLVREATGDAVGAAGARVARAALRARVQARWALDEGDPIVAEAADVGRDVVGGGLVVEQDRGRVEVALREGDDGGAAVAGVGDGVGDGVRARVSLPAAAGEDDPRGVVVAQLVEMAELRLAAELGAAHHRQVAEVRGHGLDPARDLGEVGIDDVADDHADDARAARDERAGERGWRVPELFGGLEDAIARSLGDRMGGTIQDARARGDRDARVSADVAERRHGGKRYGGERSWNMTS